MLSPELQNLLISLLFLNLYTGSKQTNASNINSSLTYKVLTTNQPQYLYNFISVQPCHDTRSSFMVTLASPPILSSLKVANRSFLYAAPCLWNELSTDLREPRQIQSPSLSPITRGSSPSSPSSLSPLASSLTRCSVFHSELNILVFRQIIFSIGP